MNDESRRIIRTFFTISGLFSLSASLIWGVNTIFLMKAGLSIFEVFIINAIFSASMAVFEIPTGVFADTLGRRKSFLFSAGVLMFGTLGYVACYGIKKNFLIFCIMSIILGLAFTFYSGAVEAWLVDALISTKYTDKIENVFSKGMALNNVSTIIGTALGGILGAIDIRIPYVLRAILLIIVFFVALVKMNDLGYIKRKLSLNRIPEEMKKIASDSIKYGLRNISIKYIMIVSFLFSSFIMWGWYAWQPYFLDLYGNNEAIWITGVVSALFSASQVLGNVSISYITKIKFKKTTILIISFGIQSIAILLVGFANSFIWATLSFCIFGIAIGISMPIKQTYLHNLIPSDRRATIISFDSMIGSAGSVVGQFSYGYISQKYSIAQGYILGGLVSFLILPILGLMMKRENKLE